MNLLESGMSFLSEQRRTHLTVPAVYRRGGMDYPVSVTPGRTVFRTENEYGQNVRTVSSDFLLSASELEFVPVRGDRIIRGSAIYEVLSPDGEPCWRWSGIPGTTLRIHTKIIGKDSSNG